MTTLSRSALCLAIALSVVLLRDLQTFGDNVDVVLRRPNSRRRLLLKRMQDVDGFRELDRIHRSERVASCDSTISNTRGPRPFHGFALGALPPNCAIPSALPMSSFTA